MKRRRNWPGPTSVEDCEYCWRRATRERILAGYGRCAYCTDHAPNDARPIQYDNDGDRICIEK